MFHTRYTNRREASHGIRPRERYPLGSKGQEYEPNPRRGALEPNRTAPVALEAGDSGRQTLVNSSYGYSSGCARDAALAGGRPRPARSLGTKPHRTGCAEAWILGGSTRPHIDLSTPLIYTVVQVRHPASYHRRKHQWSV